MGKSPPSSRWARPPSWPMSATGWPNSACATGLVRPSAHWGMRTLDTVRPGDILRERDRAV